MHAAILLALLWFFLPVSLVIPTITAVVTNRIGGICACCVGAFAPCDCCGAPVSRSTVTLTIAKIGGTGIDQLSGTYTLTWTNGCGWSGGLANETSTCGGSATVYCSGNTGVCTDLGFGIIYSFCAAVIAGPPVTSPPCSCSPFFAVWRLTFTPSPPPACGCTSDDPSKSVTYSFTLGP